MLLVDRLVWAYAIDGVSVRSDDAALRQITLTTCSLLLRFQEFSTIDLTCDIVLRNVKYVSNCICFSKSVKLAIS